MRDSLPIPDIDSSRSQDRKMDNEPHYPLDEVRARVLLEFYSHTRKAITHYSDLGWRIQSYALTLFSASIILAINPEFTKLFGLIAKTLFSVSVGIIIAVSVFFIIHCQQKLTLHRVRRQWIEIVLRLYEPKEFVDLTEEEKNQLPQKLRGDADRVLSLEKKTEKIGFSSDFLLYCLSSILLVTLVGVLVEWLIWR
jgi:hypothetical protein